MPSNRSTVSPTHGHEARDGRQHAKANAGDVRRYRPDPTTGELVLTETIVLNKVEGRNEVTPETIHAMPVTQADQDAAEAEALAMVMRDISRIKQREDQKLGLSDRDRAALAKDITMLTALRKEQRQSATDPEIAAVRAEIEKLKQHSETPTT